MSLHAALLYAAAGADPTPDTAGAILACLREQGYDTNSQAALSWCAIYAGRAEGYWQGTHAVELTVTLAVAGWTVALVLLLLAAWLWWRGRAWRAA